MRQRASPSPVCYGKQRSVSCSCLLSLTGSCARKIGPRITQIKIECEWSHLGARIFGPLTLKTQGCPPNSLVAPVPIEECLKPQRCHPSSLPPISLSLCCRFYQIFALAPGPDPGRTPFHRLRNDVHSPSPQTNASRLGSLRIATALHETARSYRLSH